jgi:hypothetical protein
MNHSGADLNRGSAAPEIRGLSIHLRGSKAMDELTDMEKSELALYFKRLTFYDVYEHTDIDTKENQKAQAYRILDAIAKLQKELADQCYNPR